MLGLFKTKLFFLINLEILIAIEIYEKDILYWGIVNRFCC